MSLIPIAGGTLNVSGTGAATDVTAVSVNAKIGAVAEYTSFAFNSFARIGGVVLGAMADGIYDLSGDDDAGADIDAATLSGVLTFTEDRLGIVDRNKKSVESVVTNMRVFTSPGAIRVRMDEVVDRLYYIQQTVFPDGIAPVRQKAGRGLVGRNVQVGYENVDGSDFEIEVAEVYPVVSYRRT